MSEEDRELETKAVHSGREVDETTKAVVPPINLSTTYEREKDGSYPKGYVYRRQNNPNRESLERCLADLENGKESILFSSGSSAAMSLFQTLEPGDHVIVPEDMYHGIARQVHKIMGPWDLDSTHVDMTDIEDIENSIREETKLIWIETPSNPLLKITDIERVCELALKNDILTVSDNTWCSPVVQRPLELGCDVVLHSLTKYIGGHSDAVAGALVTKSQEELFERLRGIEVDGGATPSPFDCWLISRGIRTLPYRVRAQSKSAFEIAKFLSEKSTVKKVHYPGLGSHPGHEIAEKQMGLFGGMLSFQVEGGREKAFEVMSNVDIFTRATSLGSVESLIEHRASIEGEDSTTPKDLLRLSIGLENSQDLIEDLDNALS